MKTKEGGQSRRRRATKRSDRPKKPVAQPKPEECPCCRRSGESGGFLLAVTYYKTLQTETNQDATQSEFIELCHPNTQVCPDGYCDLFWSLINDYEQAWLNEDPDQDLELESNFRVRGIDPKSWSLKEMKTISRWMARVLSQDPKYRAK